VPVTDPFTGMVAEIRINVDLPAGFPDKYRDAIVRAVNQCAVKKHMEQPPEFTVTTSVAVA
jgi:putative redox protein